MLATKVSKTSSQCTPCSVTKIAPHASMSAQSSAERRSLRIVTCGMSRSAAMRVSTMANCVSRPRQSSIVKKRTEKTGAPGMAARDSG